MKNDKRAEYITRDTIMKLLSDDEIARVSNGETAGHLSDRDEYLDMEHLDWGVLPAKGSTTPMGRVLSRNTVREETWNAILAHLALVRAA